MRLKEIEIKGFKSFSNKTKIEFKDGITAIVGPNGSGKSNISDAVRWVLGEQSIKTLRGSKMEDVIFAGTNNKQALGFAEVTITFDNSSGRIPIDYSEVAITRRVFRSGESEFYINKNGCRLKDIRELLMDTGIGKEGYSIIGQGRIDEILSNNSQERRGIFEEAAGIIKYKSKKEESLRKLKRTDDNLLRINDLVSELKSRETSLKKQAQKAGEYKEIYSSLRKMEINLLLDAIEGSREKYRELVESEGSLKRKLAKEEEDFKTRNNIEDRLEEELESSRELLKQENEARLNMNKELESLKHDYKMLEKQIEFTSRDLDRLKKEILEITRGIENLGLDNDQKTRELEEKRVRLEGLREKFTGESTRQEALALNIKELSSAIESSKDETVRLYNEISDKKSELNSISSLSKNMDDRILQLNKGIEEEGKKLLEAESLRGKYLGELEKLEANLRTRLLSSNKLDSKNKELEMELTRLENKIQALNISLERNMSEYKLYKKMEDSYEGYYKGVKNILKASEREAQLASGILGVVADLIKVEEEHELAISTALGSSSQFIVTRDQAAAKLVIDYLYRTKGGRVTCLPLDKIKSKTMSLNEADRKEFNVIGFASEIVEYDGSYKNIVENLLARTIIIDNMDNAVKLSNKYNNSLKIVTLKGNVINPGGSMTGGSQAYGAVNILSRKNQLDRTISEIGLEKKSRQELVDARASLVEDFRNSKNSLENVLEEIKAMELEVLDRRNKELLVSENILRINSSISNFKSEIESLNSGSSEFSRKRQLIETDISVLSEGLENLKSKIKEDSQELAKLIASRDEKSDAITNEKILISKEENIINNLEEAISKNQEASLELEAKLARNKELETSTREEIENFKLQLKELGLAIATREAELIDFANKTSSMLVDLKQKEEELEVYAARTREIFQDREKLKEQLNTKEISRVREEMTLKSHEDDLLDKYELDYEEASQFKDSNLRMEEIKPRIEEARKRLSRLGNININSIEEYEVLAERLNFILEQREDMLEAKKDLEKVISRMEKTMKSLFLKSFEEINSNFKLIFKILFNGGEANLILENKEDVLSSGIDIEAKPPGKKLQNLSSLSGGERSLVAVAILFAILKMKPSPFCVLDEIDAALDEANIGRYTAYLQEISDETQFIIITHRKKTMEMADILYGVTMEEEGISKLISVELKDFEDVAS